VSQGLHVQDAQRRVSVPASFVEHPVWCASALATKLYLLPVIRANHPDIDVDGELVRRGQYRRSLRKLTDDLHVKDSRTVRGALGELVQLQLVTVHVPQETQNHHAQNAALGRKECAAKNALRLGRPQLISVNGFNEMQASAAKNAAESNTYGIRGVVTQRARGAHAHAPLPGRAEHEANVMARARARAERRGISLETAIAEVREDIARQQSEEAVH
jgi:hypothetical protein